jgi:hypothetical protein
MYIVCPKMEGGKKIAFTGLLLSQILGIEDGYEPAAFRIYYRDTTCEPTWSCDMTSYPTNNTLEDIVYQLPTAS